ncbi:hypothetical protein G7046_g10159 [Stylonectria norvegica]|nr:hypothetical protein G7046_g10159 [Stylonectria norvegica]
MTRHIVPRAYVAFSQLTADNQHAPLGLMLLAVLARISSLLSDLVPAEHVSVLEPAKPTPVGQSSSVLKTSGPDMGVAVPRLVLTPFEDPSVPPPKSQLNLKERKLKARLGEQSSGEAPKERKRKKKKGGDELSSLFGSLS